MVHLARFVVLRVGQSGVRRSQAQSHSALVNLVTNLGRFDEYKPSIVAYHQVYFLLQFIAVTFSFIKEEAC